MLAADATEHLELTTAVAIAFARSPMTIAAQAWDLQRLSSGRFHLGLGQPDQAPHRAPLLDAVVGAGGAACASSCWRSGRSGPTWKSGVPLRFEGDHYTHTLMTPFFDPGPNPFGRRRGVARWGRPADDRGRRRGGRRLPRPPVLHARSLIEITLPALERGRARTPDAVPAPIRCHCPVMVATGGAEADLEAATLAVRAQIVFYGSTPAYRVVLDVHGCGRSPARSAGAHPSGRLGGHGGVVPDDLLHAVAIVAPPDEVAAAIPDRFGAVLDRVALNAPYAMDPDIWSAIATDLRATARLSSPATCDTRRPPGAPTVAHCAGAPHRANLRHQTPSRGTHRRTLRRSPTPPAKPATPDALPGHPPSHVAPEPHTAPNLRHQTPSGGAHGRTLRRRGTSGRPFAPRGGTERRGGPASRRGPRAGGR